MKLRMLPCSFRRDVGARGVLSEAEGLGSRANVHALHVVVDHVPGEACTGHTGTKFIEDGADEGPYVLKSTHHVALAVLDRHAPVCWVEGGDGCRAGPTGHVLCVGGPVDLDHVAYVEASHA